MIIVSHRDQMNRHMASWCCSVCGPSWWGDSSPTVNTACTLTLVLSTPLWAQRQYLFYSSLDPVSCPTGRSGCWGPLHRNFTETLYCGKVQHFIPKWDTNHGWGDVTWKKRTSCFIKRFWKWIWSCLNHKVPFCRDSNRHRTQKSHYFVLFPQCLTNNKNFIHSRSLFSFYSAAE